MRAILAAVLLVAIGAVSATVVMSWRAPTEPEPFAERAAPSTRGSDRRPEAGTARADGARRRAALEQRIELLEAKVAREAAERQRLEDQLDDVAEQLAACAAGDADAASPPVGGAGPGEAASAPAGGTDVAAAPAPAAVADAPASGMVIPPVDYSLSDIERALVAAGLDRATAADIKRRGDELAMSEMNVRDQATREQWLDTPRFAEEMAAIDAQRTSIRDEIGDEAYDRYLYAQGQTNRVRVDDVMTESPAALAGLQTHDMILRYGNIRVFAPEDLVAETRGGTAGELIRLEVIRNGERLEIDVPRGPLGLRIAPTQAPPTT